MTQDKRSTSGNNGFYYNYQHYGSQNNEEVLIHKLQIEHHSYGYKEETGERILERNEVSECVMAIARFGYHKSCKESPESKGHTQL